MPIGDGGTRPVGNGRVRRDCRNRDVGGRYQGGAGDGGGGPGHNRVRIKAAGKQWGSYIRVRGCHARSSKKIHVELSFKAGGSSYTVARRGANVSISSKIPRAMRVYQ